MRDYLDISNWSKNPHGDYLDISTGKKIHMWTNWTFQLVKKSTFGTNWTFYGQKIHMVLFDLFSGQKVHIWDYLDIFSGQKVHICGFFCQNVDFLECGFFWQWHLLDIFLFCYVYMIPLLWTFLGYSQDRLFLTQIDQQELFLKDFFVPNLLVPAKFRSNVRK